MEWGFFLVYGLKYMYDVKNSSNIGTYSEIVNK